MIIKFMKKKKIKILDENIIKVFDFNIINGSCRTDVVDLSFLR